MENLKELVDNILKEYPTTYVQKLSEYLYDKGIINYPFLEFMFEYLPYSISEEILLYNYKLFSLIFQKKIG